MPRAEPTAEDRAAVAEGALTVRGAVEHSGLSRSELYRLMADGALVWFPYGARGDRYITRASLNEVLAQLLAEHNATRAKTRSK
jgi:hypothetical protein